MCIDEHNHSNIIRVNEISTFPSCIEEMVFEKRSLLRDYLNKVSAYYSLDYRIKCAIDWHTVIADASIYELNESIKEAIKEMHLEGFHNTRVLHKESILTGGLKLLDSEDYLADLKMTLSELGVTIPVQLGVCKELNDYLCNKYGMRTGLLALFAPFNRRDEYAKFFRNIGGEICEFGLPSKFPEVYRLLANNGYPVTVRVVFPFESVTKFEKDKIVLEIIRHYAAKMLFCYYYPVAIETIVIKPIGPEGILEIIDYSDGIDANRIRYCT